MSAIETFRFGQYMLRPAGGGVWDHRLAKEWTAADPDHRDTTKPEFWLEQKPLTVDSYLLHDKKGPILFFKMVLKPGEPGPWAEVHVQFPPDQSPEAKARIAGALRAGLPWLERVLLQCHVDTLFFDSSSQPLIAFTTKRLGFEHNAGRVSKKLVPHFANF